MKLPFAVYTARQGYAWQSGTEYMPKLELLRKAIGKMPDIDLGEPLYCGMLNTGSDIVAYRFMRQEKADFRGRDAIYLALTFFTQETARFIDADILFENYPFTTPLTSPPSMLEYSGGAATPAEFVVPENNTTGCFNDCGSLTSAGFVFSKPFEGELHIVRNDPSDINEAKYAFRKNISVSVSKSPVHTTAKSKEVPSGDEGRVQSNTDMKWKHIALLLILVNILQGVCIIGILAFYNQALIFDTLGIKRTQTMPAPREPASAFVGIARAIGSASQTTHNSNTKLEIDTKGTRDNE